MSEHEQTPDAPTPASPSPAPSKAHGDAFLDESGSRHGPAPLATDDGIDDEDASPELAP